MLATEDVLRAATCVCVVVAWLRRCLINSPIDVWHCVLACACAVVVQVEVVGVNDGPKTAEQKAMEKELDGATMDEMLARAMADPGSMDPKMLAAALPMLQQQLSDVLKEVCTASVRSLLLVLACEQGYVGALVLDRLLGAFIRARTSSCCCLLPRPRRLVLAFASHVWVHQGWGSAMQRQMESAAAQGI